MIFIPLFFMKLNSERIKKSITLSRVIWAWVMFSLIYILLTGLNGLMLKDLSAFLWEEIYNLFKLLYGFAGILALYFTAVYYTKIKTLPNVIVKVGKYCFGVYLFQQFILHGLYYNTHLPQILGVYLPWISFMLTIITSVLFSIFIRRFNWGKALI